MYKIIGADQREYGPVSADQIRQWIREGRANANTLCQAEGTTGFRAISTFPEFGFPQAAPPLPPQPPVYSSTGGTNGNAVTGLIFGILACTCPCGSFFTGAIGIVFSCIALSQLSHSTTEKGKGLAIAGLVLSIIGLMFWTGIGALSLLPHGHAFRHWSVL
jgi:hypothetical protein